LTSPVGSEATAESRSFWLLADIVHGVHYEAFNHHHSLCGEVGMNQELDINGLRDLRDLLRRFADDRDWEQYHSPKNLAAALVVEAAELLEHFQWLSEDASMMLSSRQHEEVREEMADVMLYLVRMADKLNVDLIDEARKKIEKNAEKYPVEKARGSSRKYTEF
jgi:dCTP diphosphatase